ncbi:MAG TPA: hypothetical protein VN784_14385 [Candidatus Limnocylindrales bacterium]|nr:hypothetical protein [Candidatus Limnocylindrales bacterium]
MKTFILIAIFITQLAGYGDAVTVPLPEIPAPELTAPQVLAIAQQHLGSSTNYTLVSIDWCKASDFQPRYSDGTDYSPGNDEPNGYSWFITYVYRDEQMAKAFGGKSRFNSVLVMRIKDDGKTGLFIGGRT